MTNASCILLIVCAIASCADDKKQNYHIDKFGSTVVDAGDESESESESESDNGIETTSGYDDSSYGGYTPSPTQMPIQDQQYEPRRDQCRACNGTGACPICDGNGQTHTKRVYNYDLGCYDLDWKHVALVVEVENTMHVGVMDGLMKVLIFKNHLNVAHDTYYSV